MKPLRFLPSSAFPRPPSRIGADLPDDLLQKIKILEAAVNERQGDYAWDSRGSWATRNRPLLKDLLANPILPPPILATIAELGAAAKDYNLLRTLARHPNLPPPTTPEGYKPWNSLFTWHTKDAFQALLRNKLYLLEDPLVIEKTISRWKLYLCDYKLISSLLTPKATYTFHQFHQNTEAERWRFWYPSKIVEYPFGLFATTSYTFSDDDAYTPSMKDRAEIEELFRKYLPMDAKRSLYGGQKDTDIPMSLQEYLALADKSSVGKRTRARIGAQEDPAAFFDRGYWSDEEKIQEGLELLSPDALRAFALQCAKSVFPLWQSAYPKDKVGPKALSDLEAVLQGAPSPKELLTIQRKLISAINRIFLWDTTAAQNALQSLTMAASVNPYQAAYASAKQARAAVVESIDLPDTRTFDAIARTVAKAEAEQLGWLRNYLRHCYAEAQAMARENHWPALEGNWPDVVWATLLRERARRQIAEILDLELTDERYEKAQAAMGQLAEVTKATDWIPLHGEGTVPHELWQPPAWFYPNKGIAEILTAWDRMPLPSIDRVGAMSDQDLLSPILHRIVAQASQLQETFGWINRQWWRPPNAEHSLRARVYRDCYLKNPQGNPTLLLRDFYLTLASLADLQGEFSPLFGPTSNMAQYAARWKKLASRLDPSEIYPTEEEDQAFMFSREWSEAGIGNVYNDFRLIALYADQFLRTGITPRKLTYAFDPRGDIGRPLRRLEEVLRLTPLKYN